MRNPTWNMVSNEPIFGRTVKSSPTYVIVQHWTRLIAATTAGPSIDNLSPSSTKLALIQCSGYSLSDPNAGLTTGSRVDNFLREFPCLFRITHAQCTDLKHLELRTFNFSD